jgi:hypothetical protein
MNTLLRVNAFYLCVLLLGHLEFLHGQTYTNHLFQPNYKTLTIYPDGKWDACPVIEQGSASTVQIAFDELSHDLHRLSYRIVHCNSDWKRSELETNEYVDGFAENDIDSSEQSVGTLTAYTHYAFHLPNDRVSLKRSGNYAVEIVDKDGGGETLLTACFRVCESGVSLQGEVTASTDLDFKKEHQQLKLEVDASRLNPRQPLQDLQIVVEQNRRRESAVSQLHPDEVRDGKLFYPHESKLIFPGGNEYRRFETTSYKYAGLNTNRVFFQTPTYHVELLPSEKRNKGYTIDKDQDGRFLIRSQEAMDPRVGADYFWVHFSIPMDEPMLDGGFYLNGDLVQNRFDATSKLMYNFEHKAYEKELLLKQGSYNYQYVTMASKGGKATVTPMEGSYWETENTYQVYVYYRPLGERYDKLVGFTEITTAF